MAIDPSISLHAQVPQIGNMLMQGAQQYQQNKRQDFRDNMLKQQMDNQQQELQRTNMVKLMPVVAGHLESLAKLPPEQRSGAHMQFEAQLKQLGYPVDDTEDDLSDDGLRRAYSAVSGFLPRLNGNAAVKIAPTQTGYDVINPMTGGTIRSVTGVKPSLDQKVEADIRAAGGKRSAEAAIDLRTKPAITTAVTTAEQTAKDSVDRKGAERSNSIAFGVYETGMSNLLKSLGDTTTGPIAGRLPALTASQQIAEGAQAAMAPVLKQMFRGAGEGTFTDKDQEMLLKMLPTRSDHPEAAKAKIQGIDAIVRAKLNQSGATPSAAPQNNAQSMSADDQAAIEWANANPNDPRAAQILKLHGAQ